jgi:phage terminase large subunit-like protein
MSRPALNELLDKKRKLEHLIRADPARFFRPNAGGQRAFLTLWDDPSCTKRVALNLAGNKSGKTTAGALLMGERLWGKSMWDRESREGVSYPTPAVGIVFTEDFESHRDTTLPTIRTWWPSDVISKISYNNANCPSELVLSNGSILKFKTYAQGAETVEGKDWDIVWFDEPPPHSVYIAAFRGVVSFGGRIFVTATLLKEAWLFDEQEQDYAAFFTSTIHDNEWLSEQAKADFLSSLTDEEREVRELGKPFSLTGLIYKYFKDDFPYVIPTPEFMPEWPYFIGVDPHERRPVHVGFFTMTPAGQVIMISYGLFRGETKSIIDQIRAKEEYLQLPKVPRLCIMDPNRGKARQINNISWEQVFSEAGYDVVLGQDDLNIGHSEMYRWLRIEEKTGHPRLLFTTDCRGKFGPIHQMQRYAWDDWTNNNTRRERDIKETPKQINKDFPDICRYVVMENLDYDSLVHGPKILKTFQNTQPYGKIMPLGSHRWFH